MNINNNDIIINDFKSGYKLNIKDDENKLKYILNKIVEFLNRRFDINEKKYSVIISYDDKKTAENSLNILQDTFISNGYDVYIFNDAYPKFVLSYMIRRIESAVLGVMLSFLDDDNYLFRIYDESGHEYINERLVELSYLLKGDDRRNILQKQTDDGIVNIVGEELINRFIDSEVLTSYFLNIYRGERKTKLYLLSQSGTYLKFVKEALKKTAYDVNIIELDGNIEEELNSEELSKSDVYSLFVILNNNCEIEKIYYKNIDKNLKLISSEEIIIMVSYFINQVIFKRNVLPPNAFINTTINVNEKVNKFYERTSLLYEESGLEFKYVTNMIKESKKRGFNSILAHDNSYTFLVADFVKEKDAIQSLILILDLVEYLQRQGKNISSLVKELDKETDEFKIIEENLEIVDANSFINKLRREKILSIANKDITKKLDYFTKRINDYYLDAYLPFEDENQLPINMIKYIFENDEYVILSSDLKNNLLITCCLNINQDINFKLSQIKEDIKSIVYKD